MIASPTLDSPVAYTRTEKGESEAATFLVKALREVREHYSRPRLQLLEPEIMALLASDAVNEGSEAVREETAQQALIFAMLLPKSLPLPEVAQDPDGEISFDWIGKSGKMFSVSVGPDGTISYAGWFSDKSKVDGVEQLSERCPREILLGIEKAIG